jgi:hypothetical protein
MIIEAENSGIYKHIPYPDDVAHPDDDTGSPTSNGSKLGVNEVVVEENTDDSHHPPREMRLTSGEKDPDATFESV